MSAADPDTVTVDTTVTVRITGSGFSEGSTASWIIDTTQAPGIRTLSTKYTSPTELEAIISVSPDAELRTYRIRVRSKKGKQGIGVERFRVVAKPVPLPAPGVRSTAVDVNDSGVIVGSGADAFGSGVALRWTPADSGWSYTVLGTGDAVAVNNAGLVVRRDFDRVTGFWHSWIHFPSGAAVEMGPVYVNDISNNGTLIGSTFDGSIYDPKSKSTAVTWTQISPTSWGAPLPVPILPGYSGAGLTAINSTGDIAGVLSSTSASLGVVWRYRDGQWQAPEPIDLVLEAGANAINDVGVVVGWVWPCIRALLNCYSSPALWSSPGAPRQILPTLYNSKGYASDINNTNLIVGSALVHYNDGSGPLAATIDHAVVWFPGGQLPEDLGAINPWQSGRGSAINDHGLVVGSVRDHVAFPYYERATIWKIPGVGSLTAPLRMRSSLTLGSRSQATSPRP